MQVVIAQQNVSYAAADAKVTMVCSTNYYGQEAFQVYPTKPSCQQCNPTQVNCMRLYNPYANSYSQPQCAADLPCATYTNPFNGRKSNCTAVTTVNEFCVKCPDGSNCPEKIGQSTQAIKSIAVAAHHVPVPVRPDRRGSHRANGDPRLLAQRQHQPGGVRSAVWRLVAIPAAPRALLHVQPVQPLLRVPREQRLQLWVCT
jgi:hypothetical protein